jgi:hypothetical protein
VSTRLQPLNLIEFTGGVNYETQSFKLEPNESPDMVNVTVDRRGGFYTRRGGRRWQGHANIGEYVPAGWVAGPVARFPGGASNDMRTIDKPSLDLVGDLDVRVHAAADNWVPGGSSFQALMAKFETSRSWNFRINNANGRLQFLVTVTGQGTSTVSSSVAVPFVNGQGGWLRVTRVATTGVINFYTSTDGTTWTLLSGPHNATAGPPAVGTANLHVGSDNGGVTFAGRIFRATLRDGIDGTIVADYVPGVATDAYGNIWLRRGTVVEVPAGSWLTDANVRADELPFTTWKPRNAESHVYPDDFWEVFVTSEGLIHVAGPTGAFGELGVKCNAQSHLADFASWGQSVYIATGAKADEVGGAPVRRAPSLSPITKVLTVAGTGHWADDYTQPVGGVMPQADLVEAHGGYLFVASTKENNVLHPNRVRWSHPGGHPEDWAELDFIDIERGGGRITALLSFQDHLLIFKRDSVWALYGYDADSWQLIQVSMSAGTLGPHTVARSEDSVYFFSPTGIGRVWRYTGQQVSSISDRVEDAMGQITDFTNVWVDWVHDSLAVTVPFTPPAVARIIGDQSTPSDMAREPRGRNPNGRSTATVAGCSTLLWDPSIGQGAWVVYRPARGCLGPIARR